MPAIILGMIVFLYGFCGNAEEVATRGHSAILWMVSRWNGVAGDLAHCWLIPVVSAVVVWMKRRELAAAPRSVSGAGLAVVACSLLLYLAGVRAQQTRITLLSLVVILWGIPLALYGRQVARILVFPCAYLIFCIPMSFLDSITVPLRLMASSAAAHILNGIGVAVARSGTIVEVLAGGGFKVDVAEPCSGLRSLLTLTALAAPYACFTQRELWKKWFLFAASAPLAVAGNIVRIITIVSATRILGPERGLHFSHSLSGFVVFATAVLLMVAVGELLKVNWREKGRAWLRQEPKHASS